jgi:hypothetical protein
VSPLSRKPAARDRENKERSRPDCGNAATVRGKLKAAIARNRGRAVTLKNWLTISLFRAITISNDGLNAAARA